MSILCVIDATLDAGPLCWGRALLDISLKARRNFSGGPFVPSRVELKYCIRCYREPVSYPRCICLGCEAGDRRRDHDRIVTQPVLTIVCESSFPRNRSSAAERALDKREVVGSMPTGSTSLQGLQGEAALIRSSELPLTSAPAVMPQGNTGESPALSLGPNGWPILRLRKRA
jgi:hypothetical protein